MREETTRCLARWAEGSEAAGDEVFQRVYGDLRRVAGSCRFRVSTLDSTSDYLQDLCLRLFDQRSYGWRSRAHFLAIASRLMRRVAVDEARRERAQKRGGDLRRVPLEGLEAPGSRVDLLAVDEALSRLAEASPSAARVVELRYFAGLSLDETAEVLGVGRATVARRWSFAKACLAMHLEGEATVAEPA